MVTIPRIIIIEGILLVISMIFSSLTTGIGEVYFSPAMLVCSNMTKTWAWSGQMALYFVPDILIMASTIAALYRLILKQRRAIASAALPSQTKQADDNESRLQSQSREQLHSSCPDVAPTTSRLEAEAANAARTLSTKQSVECYAKNVKAAIKLVSGISGVFWFTLFPAVIGMNFMRSRNLIIDAEMAWHIEARTVMRFLNYLPTLAWASDPIMYFLINSTLKAKLYEFFRKQ